MKRERSCATCGIYGQYNDVDTARGGVIALNTAERKFREQGVGQSDIDTPRAIAEGI
jgi:hypothetical protein